MAPQGIKKEFAQLLRLHEQVMAKLQRVKDDLRAPATVKLLKEIRNRSGTAHDTNISEVAGAVEEAIRVLKLSESVTRHELLEAPREVSLEGVANLPATLARFLAEREDLPGFTYEVVQDEVRGWVIAWKEYTESGTVRGAGQFYERPYAWLDE